MAEVLNNSVGVSGSEKLRFQTGQNALFQTVSSTLICIKKGY